MENKDSFMMIIATYVLLANIKAISLYGISIFWDGFLLRTSQACICTSPPLNSFWTLWSVWAGVDRGQILWGLSPCQVALLSSVSFSGDSSTCPRWRERLQQTHTVVRYQGVNTGKVCWSFSPQRDHSEYTLHQL